MPAGVHFLLASFPALYCTLAGGLSAIFSRQSRKRFEPLLRPYVTCSLAWRSWSALRVSRVVGFVATWFGVLNRRKRRQRSTATKVATAAFRPNCTGNQGMKPCATVLVKTWHSCFLRFLRSLPFKIFFATLGF